MQDSKQKHKATKVKWFQGSACTYQGHHDGFQGKKCNFCANLVCGRGTCPRMGTVQVEEQACFNVFQGSSRMLVIWPSTVTDFKFPNLCHTKWIWRSVGDLALANDKKQLLAWDWASVHSFSKSGCTQRPSKTDYKDGEDLGTSSQTRVQGNRLTVIGVGKYFRCLMGGMHDKNDKVQPYRISMWEFVGVVTNSTLQFP